MTRSNSNWFRGAAFLGCAVIAFCIAVAGSNYWKRSAPKTGTLHVDCTEWDQAVRAGFVALIADDSARADLRVDEALAQLRRARKYCRSGHIDVARRDYQALERSLTGNVNTARSDSSAREALVPTGSIAPTR